MKIELPKCYREIEGEAFVDQRNCVAEFIVQYQSRFDVFHVVVDQTDAIFECNQQNNVKRSVAQRAYVDDIEISLFAEAFSKFSKVVCED